MLERKLSTTNGIKIFIALSGYFLIMQFLGLQDKYFLRFANLFIIYYFVNKTLRNTIQQERATLLGVFFSGIITSSIGVIMSVIAFTFYISFVTGTSYLAEIGNSFIPLGDSSSLIQYSFALIIEGMCSSLLISMYLMQKWKNNISVNPLVTK